MTEMPQAAKRRRSLRLSSLVCMAYDICRGIPTGDGLSVPVACKGSANSVTRARPSYSPPDRGPSRESRKVKYGHVQVLLSAIIASPRLRLLAQIE
ncbi:hypothetical protein LIA77_05816 [Sarocladium implicatum]|nr:hypothetical protein LIA77_05816 [Sarocladium implicatum]